MQMCCLLEMAEELEKLLPALVQALTGLATRSLWDSLQSLSQALQAEARSSFTEFEGSLGRDASKPTRALICVISRTLAFAGSTKHKALVTSLGATCFRALPHQQGSRDRCWRPSLSLSKDAVPVLHRILWRVLSALRGGVAPALHVCPCL